MMKMPSRSKAVFLSLLFIPLIFFMSAKGVYAANIENGSGTGVGSNIAQCNGGNLSNWDWPEQVKTLPHQTGTKVPDTLFSPANTDYIIYLTQTQFSTPNNAGYGYSYQYTMLDAGQGGNLKLYTIGTDTFAKNYGTQGQQLSSYYFTLIDSWSVTSSTNFPFVTGSLFSAGNTSVAASDAKYKSFGLTSAGTACILAVHGVEYDPGYTGPVYKSSQAYTLGAGAGCQTLDIACKLSGAFQTVTTAIGDLIREVFSWFMSLWIPDSAKTQASFDDLGNFLSNKLGFLTYPFTFINDFYSAMGGSATWCSTSSCTISGTVMGGGTATLDLLGMAHSPYSPVWDAFLLFIRATTIVTLMGMLLSRVKEIQTK